MVGNTCGSLGNAYTWGSSALNDSWIADNFPNAEYTYNGAGLVAERAAGGKLASNFLSKPHVPSGAWGFGVVE